MGDINTLGKPHWNFEPCEAQYGKIEIKQCSNPDWWYRNRVGTRVVCIKLKVAAEEFYIFGDQRGLEKVYLYGGGPQSGHSSFETEDLDLGSFQPLPLQQDYTEEYWKRMQRYRIDKMPSPLPTPRTRPPKRRTGKRKASGTRSTNITKPRRRK